MVFLFNTSLSHLFVGNPFRYLDPGFWWPKNGKFSFKNKFKNSKIATYLFLGLHERLLSYGKSLQPGSGSTRFPNRIHSKHCFIVFLLFRSPATVFLFRPFYPVLAIAHTVQAAVEQTRWLFRIETSFEGHPSEWNGQNYFEISPHWQSSPTPAPPLPCFLEGRLYRISWKEAVGGRPIIVNIGWCLVISIIPMHHHGWPPTTSLYELLVWQLESPVSWIRTRIDQWSGSGTKKKTFMLTLEGKARGFSRR